MSGVLAWHSPWLASLGTPPSRPSSREESIQQVLARLLVGHSPSDFLPYSPTPAGERLARAVWETAFGDPPERVDWVTSEYSLPVPHEWRAEINLSYRCPDFAFGAANRILLLELKTEWGSYKRAQVFDFLRLARRLHPDASIDLVLLEERLRGAAFETDARQRYTEMTWAQIADLMRHEMGGNETASRLCAFLDASLASAVAPASLRATDDAAVPAAASSASVPSATARERGEPSRPGGGLPPLVDRIATAIDQALHIAPALAVETVTGKAERGVNVPFASQEEAREAEAAIRAALTTAGHAGVSTWLWRTASKGVPATPAGRAAGIELRLAPTR